MQNMEARCRKAYVCVNLDVDKEGAINLLIKCSRGLTHKKVNIGQEYS